MTENIVCLAHENNLSEVNNAPCGGVPSSEDGRNPVDGDQACEYEQNTGNGDEACEEEQNTGNGDQPPEKRPDTADQPNPLSSSTGPYLNPDVLEEIIQQTLHLYPNMRPSLRAVSKFFRNIVDQEPLPQVYIPELNDVTDIRRVSVRKIMRLKGKNSGAVIRLREIINSALWVSAWLSLIAAGNGWFYISKIYRKPKNQN